MSAFSRVWSWLRALFSTMGKAPPVGSFGRSGDDDRRVQRYLYHRRIYDGYAARGASTVVSEDGLKRLIYNFARPVCNVAAGFVASDALVWSVSKEDVGDDENSAMSAAAKDVWDRSGGEGALVAAALSCSIHGDTAGIVRFDGEKARIQFVDACNAVPEFAAGDLDRLEALTIAYPVGEAKWHVEMWTPSAFTVARPDGNVVESAVPGIMPAVWIRNEALLGDRYGRSDIFPIDEAIHEYDHVCRKQTQAIDYHANPTVYVTGVDKSNTEFKKNIRSIWFLPQGATCGYLEWRGTPPAVGEHLGRLRTAISEVSETPPIAFGQVDSGFAGATGISLKVLYGPLVRKTTRKRHAWGTALRYLMWVALQAEGHDLALEDVDLAWPDPTPESAKEFLESLLAKQRLGVSDSQLQLEAGYDQAQIEEMAQERREMAEESAARQQRIFSAGGAPAE